MQGKACNVARAEQVKALAAYAQQQLGSIDLWCVVCLCGGWCRALAMQCPGDGAAAAAAAALAWVRASWR
jgi:hypothetical protein